MVRQSLPSWRRVRRKLPFVDMTEEQILPAANKHEVVQSIWSDCFQTLQQKSKTLNLEKRKSCRVNPLVCLGFLPVITFWVTVQAMWNQTSRTASLTWQQRPEFHATKVTGICWPGCQKGGKRVEEGPPNLHVRSPGQGLGDSCISRIPPQGFRISPHFQQRCSERTCFIRS